MKFWKGWFPLLLVCLLAAGSAWVYFKILPLSLGPHAVLEPWLINQGFLLYDHLADHHSPMMALGLALGQKLVPNGLLLARLVLTGLIFATTVCIFLLTRRRANLVAGLSAVLFFLAWSYVFGYGNLRHETFATLFYLLAAACWENPFRKAPARLNGFLLGVFCGLAFLFKQQALVLILGVVIWNGLNGICLKIRFGILARQAGWAVAGFLLPAVGYTGFHLLNGGSLSALWYWVFGFVDGDLAAMLALPPKIEYLQAAAPALLSILIYILWWLPKFNLTGKSWWNGGKILVILAASLTFAIPRFNSVHLQPFFALTAVLSGTIFASLIRSALWEGSARLLQKGLAFLLAGLWLVGAANGTIPYLIAPGPQKIYEFSSLPPLAGEIRQLIGETECAYIAPEDEANSNLYYLLGCLPPRPWAFTSYPWYSRNGLGEAWLAALVKMNPKYVVFYPGRWQIETHNPNLVQYILENYTNLAPLEKAEGTAFLMVHR